MLLCLQLHDPIYTFFFVLVHYFLPYGGTLRNAYLSSCNLGGSRQRTTRNGEAIEPLFFALLDCSPIGLSLNYSV